MTDGPQTYDRIKRQLGEAEGYLMLNLPAKALGILESRDDWATMQFEAALLSGEALRTLGRYRDALKPLEVAAGLRPGDISVAIALGWCYKRTHRLAQAIDALGRAARHTPDEPLLHYNLACYWSLAAHPAKALDALAVALDLDPELRHRIAEETDFDTLRGNPEFDRLTVGHRRWLERLVVPSRLMSGREIHLGRRSRLVGELRRPLDSPSMARVLSGKDQAFGLSPSRCLTRPL